MRIIIFVLVLISTGEFGILCLAQYYSGYGSGGGTINGGISGNADLAINGGGSKDGYISGGVNNYIGGNANIQGSGDIWGGIQGNLQGGFEVDPSLSMRINSCMCSCLSQLGLSTSGKVEGSVDGQGSLSIDADASLNWDVYGCGSGSVETTTLQDGYTYNLNVTRVMTHDYVNDVVCLPYRPSNEPERLRYVKAVDAANPFWIDGSITYGKSDSIYEIPRFEKISSCEEHEDSDWDSLIAKTVTTFLTPTGTCPVEKGEYTFYRNKQVTVTFKEMLKCGDYELHLYVDNADQQWCFEFIFDFTLPDDGTCVP